MCDCGGAIRLDTRALQRGAIRDCGCETRVRPGRHDLTGMHFGGQTLLQNGKTRSCGCLQAAVLKENLKLCEGTSVTFLEAGKRRRLRTNTSGCTGVYCDKRTGHWIAQITFKHKTYYLGSYRTLEEAAAARQHGEKMHDNFLEWYYQQHRPSCAKEETA